MNVSPIKYNYNCSMTSQNANKKQDVNTEYLKIGKAKVPYTPTTIGVLNGVLWFGINLALDKIISLATNRKTSLKSSLIFSGIIGAGAGVIAYVRSRNDLMGKKQ